MVSSSITAAIHNAQPATHLVISQLMLSLVFDGQQNVPSVKKNTPERLTASGANILTGLRQHAQGENRVAGSRQLGNRRDIWQ